MLILVLKLSVPTQYPQFPANALHCQQSVTSSESLLIPGNNTLKTTPELGKTAYHYLLHDQKPLLAIYIPVTSEITPPQTSKDVCLDHASP